MDNTQEKTLHRKGVLIGEVLVLAALVVGILIGRSAFSPFSSADSGNYSNEMKMEYRTNFDDYGASAVERQGDHQNSPYFYSMDIYNAEPTDSLAILPHFQTIQQTSW